MISTIQSYQLNNKVVDVDLEQVPVLADSSKKVFQELFYIHLPPSFQSSTPLKDRVETLEAAAAKLRHAFANSTKDKLCGLLVGALNASLIAATILLTLYVSPWCGFVGIAAMFTSLLANMDAYHRMGLREDEGIAFGVMFGAGVFMPMIEGLTREMRERSSFEEQRQSLAAALQAFKKENQKCLPLAYAFYKEQAPALFEKLNQKIEQSEKSLAEIQQLSERSLAGEQDLRERLKTLQRAKEDLSAVVGFFRQFDA